MSAASTQKKKEKEKEVRNYIPDDVVFSVLSKLPLKSLKRFECVCKSWSLLFEINSHFMTIFRNNLISNHASYYRDHSLLVQDFDSRLYTLFGERYENKVKLDWPNPFQEDQPAFYILGSSSANGTFCLYQQETQILLWNPAAKEEEEFKVLPPSSLESSVSPYRDDPSFILHGYGYDHLRDDYKVIRLAWFYPFKDRDVVWEIYSLRSNSWKILDVDMPLCLENIVGSRLYKDGMCHWWGGVDFWGIGDSEKHNYKPYLVSFDLSKEVFFTTLIPLDTNRDSFGSKSFGSKFVKRHLGVLNGSIALTTYSTNTFHISILGEIGVEESWTKLFIVGPLPCVVNLIGVGNKGVLFFRKKDDELVWFDLNTQIIEELGVKGDRRVSQIIIYKESLLPIGGISN